MEKIGKRKDVGLRFCNNGREHSTSLDSGDKVGIFNMKPAKVVFVISKVGPPVLLLVEHESRVVFRNILATRIMRNELNMLAVGMKA